MSCAGDGGCTTTRHKTHSTGTDDEVAIAYAWHPWAGRSVHVREVIERTTGMSARCGLVGAAADRFQEIPVWMLDASTCRSMRASNEPVAALSALRSLRSLLSEAAGRASAASSPEPRIASPDRRRGDRHAPSPSPTPDAGPSTRPLPTAPNVNAASGAGMGRPAGSDAAGGDRADDPSADRARRRHDRRAGERRR